MEQTSNKNLNAMARDGRGDGGEDEVGNGRCDESEEDGMGLGALYRRGDGRSFWGRFYLLINNLWVGVVLETRGGERGYHTVVFRGGAASEEGADRLSFRVWPASL